MNYVMLDLETTGVNKSTHEICDLAFVGLTEKMDIMPGIYFSTLIKITRPECIDPKSMEINGLNRESLKDAPTPAQVRRALMEWKYDIFGDQKLMIVGWNPQFDCGFLELMLKDMYADLFMYRFVDIHSIIQYINLKGSKGMNPAEISMDAMCETLKITRASPHRALTCCYEEYKVLARILGKQVPGELISNSSPSESSF